MDKNQRPQDFIDIELKYKPPFDWQNVRRYLEGHLLAGVESLTPDTFSRVFQIGDTIGAFSFFPHPKKHSIVLKVTRNQSANVDEVVRRVRAMLDLDFDAKVVSQSLNLDRHVGQLVKKHSSLRLVRGWDPFETSIGIILGQLVSTARARHMFHDLVSNHGEPVTNEFNGERAFLFPSPEKLALASLAKVPTTGMRKQAIREFARHIHEGLLDFSVPHDLARLREQMIAIKGIGPWTVEFVCMRALGDPDAFPDKDLILDRVLKLRPGLKIEKLRPWRSYSALYLWREYADKLTGRAAAEKSRAKAKRPARKPPAKKKK